MINNDMRLYDYFTFGLDNDYGAPTLSKERQGVVKMAINMTSQSIQDNIKYKDAAYVGLTLDKEINDSYVIQYGDEKLKVLYVNPKGKYKQVFLKNV